MFMKQYSVVFLSICVFFASVSCGHKKDGESSVFSNEVRAPEIQPSPPDQQQPPDQSTPTESPVTQTPPQDQTPPVVDQPTTPPQDQTPPPPPLCTAEVKVGETQFKIKLMAFIAVKNDVAEGSICWISVFMNGKPIFHAENRYKNESQYLWWTPNPLIAESSATLMLDNNDLKSEMNYFSIVRSTSCLDPQPLNLFEISSVVMPNKKLSVPLGNDSGNYFDHTLRTTISYGSFDLSTEFPVRSCLAY